MSILDLFRINEFKTTIAEQEAKLRELGYDDYASVKAEIERMNAAIARADQSIKHRQETIARLTEEDEKLQKQYNTSQRKAAKIKEVYRAVEYSIEKWHSEEYNPHALTSEYAEDFDELLPTVTLKLHCQDMKDLRKAFRENEKAIDNVVAAYKGRYTTKANQTIYDLMVIALRAELQNILFALKYDKLEAGIDNVKKITAKYLEIAANGNQSILSTLKKFIGEIEYLFINAVKIEYNYYVKKEQARQEQIAIREQMRQEAEERKALEKERKRIEAEEKKYEDQIAALKARIGQAGEDDEKLNAEILKVESNLSDVVLKKDEISKLEHGKAGFIYIISNLGSFGENVFKVGMTRRSDPQDRVDELGDASVPFKYDVHSFIFSEDAVALETELHHRLNDKRVNKVNLRKEFFYATIDELEELTNEISPAAEFTRTMLAEEFRQSLSAEGNYTSDYSPEDFDEE